MIPSLAATVKRHTHTCCQGLWPVCKSMTQLRLGSPALFSCSNVLLMSSKPYLHGTAVLILDAALALP